MEREQNGEEQRLREQEARRESGLPGGGQGRRDEVGRSGVYRVSDAEGASPDAPLRSESAWGQGDLGAAGYEESGSSELNFDPESQAGLLNQEDESASAEQSGQ